MKQVTPAPIALNTQEVGFVRSVKEFLISLDGLPNIRLYDLVANEKGIRGFVNALQTDQVDVLQLDEGIVQPGQPFYRVGEKMTLAGGSFLLGRAINPLGVPIDGKGQLPKTGKEVKSETDRVAPGISFRELIDTQFETGIGIIDTLIPLGCGQRELILGDARTGKNDVLIDIIVNQKGKDIYCIYASIGKPISEVRNTIDTLRTNGALDYTCIVAASSSDPAPLIYLTPQSAMTVAEHFQSLGKKVLVVLDDLGIHAKIAREIALLSNRLPGRESYPGDIFYLHSHLLERAGNFNSKAKGGSITCLPVIELNLSDFTTYIPTNLMAMTDGHLLFKSSLYNKGHRPAIDTSLSISRVGQQTQNRAHNMLATRIKQLIAQAMELETMSSFSSELPLKTQIILKQHELLEELFKQESLTNMSREFQMIFYCLPFTTFFQGKGKEFVQQHKNNLFKSFSTIPELVEFTKGVTRYKTDVELITALERMGPLFARLTGERA